MLYAIWKDSCNELRGGFLFCGFFLSFFVILGIGTGFQESFKNEAKRLELQERELVLKEQAMKNKLNLEVSH